MVKEDRLAPLHLPTPRDSAESCEKFSADAQSGFKPASISARRPSRNGGNGQPLAQSSTGLIDG